MEVGGLHGRSWALQWLVAAVEHSRWVSPLHSNRPQNPTNHRTPLSNSAKFDFLKGPLLRRGELLWFKPIGFTGSCQERCIFSKEKSGYAKAFELFFMGSPLITNNDIILSFNKLRGDFMVVSICLLKDESKRGSHLECEARLPCTSPCSLAKSPSYSKPCIKTDFM